MADEVTPVWHYTIGRRAFGILEDRVIKGATEGVPDGEKPIVWFSGRQIWEPTATKAIIVNGVRRKATMEEMIAEGGLWRFGIDKAELLSWSQLQIAANMTRHVARALEAKGRQVGVDPSFWYGSLEPIAVDRCKIQCMLKLGGEWGRPGPQCSVIEL